MQSHKGVDAVFTENAAVGTAATAAVDAAQLTGKVSVGTMEASTDRARSDQERQDLFLINEQPYLDGYYGVLFAYHYAKFGLAPVGGLDRPQRHRQDQHRQDLTVFDTYPNVIGAK